MNAESVAAVDRRAWATLFLGPFAALVALAGQRPDDVLLGNVPVALTLLAVLPSAIYGWRRGPRPEGTILLAFVVGFSWYWLAWIATWIAHAGAVDFFPWFEAVNAEMSTITTTAFAGVNVGTEETQGVSMELHFRVAASCGFAALVPTAIGRTRARCHACQRPVLPRFLGVLPFEGEPLLAAAERALTDWLAAPTPLPPASPLPAGTAQMVRVATCAHCGASAVKGFLYLNRQSAGHTRDLPVPAEAIARLPAA